MGRTITPYMLTIPHSRSRVCRHGLNETLFDNKHPRFGSNHVSNKAGCQATLNIIHSLLIAQYSATHHVIWLDEYEHPARDLLRFTMYYKNQIDWTNCIGIVSHAYTRTQYVNVQHARHFCLHDWNHIRSTKNTKQIAVPLSSKLARQSLPLLFVCTIWRATIEASDAINRINIVAEHPS